MAEAVPAAELARRLLPVAHGGLVQAGVAEGEAGRLLEVMAARVRTGQTGAVWQRRGLLALRRRYGPQQAPGCSWPATWSWPARDGQSMTGRRQRPRPG